LTVKLVIPAGVEANVLMVKVDVFDVSVAENETGFGENETVTPAGNVVVTHKSGDIEPELPLPVPLFMVTVKVTFPAVPYVSAPVCVPTTTEPTLGVSVKSVVVAPEIVP
jgi:hypothetical protein